MNTPRLLVATTVAALIAACGGGTGGTGVTNNPGPANALSVGVNQAGGTTTSVIVNGVTFNAAGASIKIDNASGKQPGDLQPGMVVKVRGQINDDGVTGVAQQIEVENEVRGTVQAVNVAGLSFTVVDQTVLVNDQTVFAGTSGLTGTTALAPGNVVEVNGLRDSFGNIRASRVEVVAASANIDELRGTISSILTVSGVSVTTTGSTTFTPSGSFSDLQVGDHVEVHGSFDSTNSTFAATQIDREDLEDVDFQPGANDEVEVEGYVANLTAQTATTFTFAVNGQPVSTTASTNFQNGAPTDLVNNVEVEVEGHVANGILVAGKIAFERARVILIGVGTVVGTVPGTGTLSVFGKNVVINSLTQGNQVTNGTRVEMHGFIDVSGNIVAETVAPSSGGGGGGGPGGGGGGPGGGGGGNDVIQAPVTAVGASSVTVLGTIAADLSSTIQFSGPNGQQLPNFAAFLSFITVQSSSAPGTLVKITGTFDGVNTITTEEAEIED